MSDDLARLLAQLDAVPMNRRRFMGTAAAGVAATIGGTMNLATAAYADEPKKGGTLRMGLGGGETTDTLDPGLADSPVPAAVNRQWGDNLVNLTADGQIEPRLAESFSSNADGTEWTFNIRQGVKFHDGS